MNNKIMIKTKTIFFYIYKIFNIIKQINAYLVAGSIVFIILHASSRIYHGANKYVDFLNNNAEQMMLLLLMTAVLFIFYSLDRKIKLRLAILVIPSIFLFVTYYLSFAFELKYYMTLPFLLSSLLTLTLCEKVFKKFRYRYTLVEIVDNEYETNGIMVQEAKLCV